MGTTLNYLTALYGTNTNNQGAGSTLATLYGYPMQATGTGQNPVTALLSAEQKQTQEINRTASLPEVQRAVNAFTAGVAKAKSVQQLLANPAVMKVLMTANGLADQIPYTALAQKALQSDVNNPKSLVNKLTDMRWKPVVQAYDFANKGLKIIQDPKVIATLANAYAEVTWRKSLDAATPGLSNALAFRKQAASVTSVDQILGDPILRKVVTTAFDIPLQIAFQPLLAQEKAISTRLDISRLKDPKFVESFAQRYLLAEGKKAAATTNTAPDLTALAIQARGLVV
jgi:hypothetical protein